MAISSAEAPAMHAAAAAEKELFSSSLKHLFSICAAERLTRLLVRFKKKKKTLRQSQTKKEKKQRWPISRRSQPEIKAELKGEIESQPSLLSYFTQ